MIFDVDQQPVLGDVPEGEKCKVEARVAGLASLHGDRTWLIVTVTRQPDTCHTTAQIGDNEISLQSNVKVER